MQAKVAYTCLLRNGYFALSIRGDHTRMVTDEEKLCIFCAVTTVLPECLHPEPERVLFRQPFAPDHV